MFDMGNFMTNFLKTFAISGAFALCFAGNISAMESIQDAKNVIHEEVKTETSLQVVQAASFNVIDRYFAGWCGRFYKVNMNAVNKQYEEYGKKYNVDVKTLRGDNFYPREFWDQPFVDIIKTLIHPMDRYKIVDIIHQYYDEELEECFGCPGTPQHSQGNSLRIPSIKERIFSQGFPIVIEKFFQFDVAKHIDTFMCRKKKFFQ